jgi:hypothetical protein
MSNRDQLVRHDFGLLDNGQWYANLLLSISLIL